MGETDGAVREVAGETETSEPAPVALELELCKACGICIELCPQKVFDRDKLGYPVIARPADCTQCLICEIHCPDFALEVRRRPKMRAAQPAVDPAGLATVREPCRHDGEEV